MMKLLSINKESQMYTFEESSGFSCMGFQVAFDRVQRLADELDMPSLKTNRIGTIQVISRYIELIKLARKRYDETGRRADCDLSPQLIGKEGRRVEVVTTYNEIRRFWVGCSTGFIPCHLEISKSNSSGGPAAEYEYKSVKVVR